jgi:hypothetical protein
MPTRSELLVGWLVLFGASLVLLALVTAAAWWQRQRPRRGLPPAEHEEAVRHAAQVAGRAVEAAGRATEARMQVRVAERERAAAWQELAQARQAHDTAARAHQDGLRRRGEQPADAESRRELAHAAYSAYRRGELSKDEFWWVWRLGNGWDPDLERQDQELRRKRGAWREAHLKYRAAADRAREAAQQADVAEVEARALIEETAESAREVDVTP